MGDTKKERDGLHEQHIKFWRKLLRRSKECGFELFATRTGSHDSSLRIDAGLHGLWYTYQIRQDGASIRLYVDTEDREENKAIFDALYAEKDDIEREFGEPLDWRAMDNVWRCVILRHYIGYGGLSQPETWDRLQEKMIDGMVRLEFAFRKRIQQI